jgi:mRNA interferase HigB
MRVIARKTLIQFWASSPKYADARAPLDAWYHEVRRADWAHPADIKEQYRSASILKSGRVVFNIAGNKYRLVVQINFPRQIVYICFVGTHKQYDQIDVETIWLNPP